MEEGFPLPVDTGRGLSLLYRGKSYYSRREPAALPARAALEAVIPEECLVLVCSPLLFHGLPELLGRLPASSSLLLVENDPLLRDLSLRFLPASLPPRCRFAFAPDIDSLLAAAGGLGYYRRVLALKLAGAYPDPAFAAAAERALRGDLSTRARNALSLSFHGRRWFGNVIANLSLLAGSEPMPRAPGALAVAVGAGPSLEGALPFIARRRDRLFVVAADTALGCLAEAGIEADLAVALESQAANAMDFAGARPVALACDLTAHPPTLAQLGSRLSFFSSRFAPSRFLDRLEESGLLPLPIPPLGSVGIAAAYLARRATEGTVLLAGLDFSYPAGKTHARGSPQWRSRAARSTRTASPYAIAPSYREGTRECGREGVASIRTDPALSGYARLLEDIAEGDFLRLLDRGEARAIPAIGLEAAEKLADAAPLAAYAKEKATIGMEAEGARSGDDIARRALAFLEEEGVRLDSIYGMLKGTRSFDRAAFLALVKESDYLYLPYADAAGIDELPQSLLNRILLECALFTEKVQASRGRIEG